MLHGTETTPKVWILIYVAGSKNQEFHISGFP